VTEKIRYQVWKWVMLPAATFIFAYDFSINGRVRMVTVVL